MAHSSLAYAGANEAVTTRPAPHHSVPTALPCLPQPPPVYPEGQAAFESLFKRVKHLLNDPNYMIRKNGDPSLAGFPDPIPFSLQARARTLSPSPFPFHLFSFYKSV